MKGCRITRGNVIEPKVDWFARASTVHQSWNGDRIYGFLSTKSSRRSECNSDRIDSQLSTNSFTSRSADIGRARNGSTLLAPRIVGEMLNEQGGSKIGPLF